MALKSSCSLTQSELQDFIKENDVKFIRLSFVDLEGVHKNISVMADEFSRVINQGLVFDGSLSAFGAENCDLKLFPDISTLHILPWRPQHGRVARFFCDVRKFDGGYAMFDVRSILRNAVNRLKEKDLSVSVGIGSEFYLFRLDQDGFPTREVHDRAGYFDIAPLDKGENVRREICLTLEEMGIRPLASHHEKGPGQNEINFVSTGALSACDNQIIFKSVVKAAASRNGLFASFLPKPLADKNGNGLTVDFKLFRNEEPVFGENNDKTALSFAAGILNRAEEMCLLFNSIPNSFARLKGGDCAKEVSFSESGNRNAFMRLAVKNNAKRLELRSVDGACNIYIVVALALLAGLEGIEKEESLPSETYLPESFSAAIEAAEKGEFLRRALGEEFVSHYIRLKKDLNDAFLQNPKATEEAAFAKF